MQDEVTIVYKKKTECYILEFKRKEDNRIQYNYKFIIF